MPPSAGRLRDRGRRQVSAAVLRAFETTPAARYSALNEQVHAYPAACPEGTCTQSTRGSARGCFQSRGCAVNLYPSAPRSLWRNHDGVHAQDRAFGIYRGRRAARREVHDPWCARAPSSLLCPPPRSYASLRKFRPTLLFSMRAIVPKNRTMHGTVKTLPPSVPWRLWIRVQ